jgi:hypothetical protein
MAVAAWALFAVLAVWLTLKSGGPGLETDAAMRLAGVRDLLAGQSWYDTAQHRMDTPFGLPMHWSRLADLGPALLLLLFHPLGTARAETLMLYVWPLLTFLPVLLALARIAGHMAGRAAAVMVLPLGLLCVEVYGLFAPGGIDHHNLQIALTLWMLVFLIEKRPAATALAITVSLAIGLETLPFALIGILAGCLWLLEDNGRAGGFGLTLAVMAGLLLFAATARTYQFRPVCDTYSEFYAALLAAGGVGLALVSLLPRWRLPAFLGLVLGVMALGFVLNKSCFAGPYAGMSQQMRTIFLSRINEARPAFNFMHFAPSEFVTGYCYAAFGTLAGLFLPRNRAVTFGTLFALAALMVATLQIREATFAILLALPGLAAMLATYALPRGVVVAALAILICSDAAFALGGVQIEGDAPHNVRIAAFHQQVACGEAPAMAPLAGLPPGRVAGFVDQGPAIMAYTPDAAIAGPYHRDADGILDTYAIFTGTPDAAHAILKRRGINYLMACAAAPDWNYYIARAPDGLLARLAGQQAPDWLSPAGHAGDVSVWRVK